MWFAWLGCAGGPTTAETTTDEPQQEASCPGDDGGEVELLVAPYVQRVTVSGATILWETAEGEGSRVELDLGPGRSQVACGALVPVLPGVAALTQVHAVRVEGLGPDATVRYRARTGATTTAWGAFRTAPLAEDEPPTRFVALGDSQVDPGNPDKLREIVQDSLIPWATATWDPDLSTAVDFAVLAGDLVNNGWEAAQWTDEFFAPAAPLLAAVPLYPVPGNHEGNSPLYFRYFELPDGGEEHWYVVDHSNVRLIGLDSNPPYDRDEQLAWLDGALDEAAGDPTIDFVVAQLHHPHRSELWPAGESDWSGEVVARLEAFSTASGKPSVHLFGHTHGYSRGQSRDHAHLWVNVSSAGGALDRWGSTPQTDYPEFVTSQDAWGFVAVEATAGDDPTLRLRRVNRGTTDTPGADEITDEIVLRADDLPPDAPAARAPGCDGADPTLRAGPFADPDAGDAHQASHWQVAPTCAALGGADGLERWRQDRDEFAGVDAQAGDDLTDESWPELAAEATVCWRVRYRDASLRWSDWSTPADAALPACGG